MLPRTVRSWKWKWMVKSKRLNRLTVVNKVVNRANKVAVAVRAVSKPLNSRLDENWLL